MGLPNSKFGKEIPNDELLEGSLPSTPILTPKITTIQELDPRSPSLNIARTPLELLSAAAEKLESYEQETPRKNKHLIIGADPRSPTTDFKRTPIILSSPGGDLLRKLHNKNLDKARLAEIETTSISNEKTSIPPKLLESSPIKSRPDAHKRRSLVGLLETNIDYTETDLDSVLQEKCRIEEKVQETNSGEESRIEEKGQEANSGEVSKTENSDSSISVCVSNDKCCLDPENLPEQCQIVESVEIVKNIAAPEPEVVQPVDVQISDSQDEQCDKQVSNKSTKLIDKADLATFPKASTSPTTAFINPILCPKEIKSEPAAPSIVNLTADVKELDKKLTNLIYEDDLVVCPRIVLLKENTERSPLKNRSGNEFMVKTTTKLKVSDKPRRSDYVVSKIPVFKEKRGKLKNQVQCENTPPRNMDKNKVRARKSDWDNKDTTLYL